MVLDFWKLTILNQTLIISVSQYNAPGRSFEIVDFIWLPKSHPIALFSEKKCLIVVASFWKVSILHLLWV